MVMNQAGLLALCATWLTFPSAVADSGLKSYRSFPESGIRRMHTGRDSTYSYGDSAGFTPDFPFNDDVSSTEFGAKIDILPHCLQQFRNGAIVPAHPSVFQLPGCMGRVIGNADMVKYVR